MHSKQRRQPRPRSGPRHKGTAQPRAKGKAAAHTSAGRVAPGERLRGRFPFALKTKHLGPGGTRPQPRRKAPATRPPQTARPRLPPRPPSNAASTSTSTSTRASLALFLVPFCAKSPTAAKRKERKGREGKGKREKKIASIFHIVIILLLCPHFVPAMSPLCPQIYL